MEYSSLKDEGIKYTQFYCTTRQLTSFLSAWYWEVYLSFHGFP